MGAIVNLGYAAVGAVITAGVVAAAVAACVLLISKARNR